MEGARLLVGVGVVCLAMVVGAKGAGQQESPAQADESRTMRSAASSAAQAAVKRRVAPTPQRRDLRQAPGKTISQYAN
jgi:hypothetical protein